MCKILFFLLIMTNVLAQEDDCRDYCIPPSSKEEYELMTNVNCESKRLYHSLDCWGKNRAIELSKDCENNNIAIQEAAKEMARRQKNEYPNQKDYQQRVQERSGQYLYNERFGY
ncbi:MAG: hypothetical protein K940chlam6_00430 [Chlamydiae bacterium]|nr:hypothetical protein [Chlamydiota bacterium]